MSTVASELRVSAAVVLRARGLTKRYGHITAVDGVSLAVHSGEVLGFLGPNGAGKTTTMRMLVGLVRPDAGTAEVLGRPAGSPASLAGTGAMVESPAFYPYLSGRDNLRALARQVGLPRERVESVLEIAGIATRGGDRFSGYSLGMKQRLGVAAALLKDPEVLILDEPTNGLDPLGIADMRSLIRGLAEANKAVLLSSHQLGEIEQICDRVAVLVRGRIVAEGTIDELRGAPQLVVRATPIGDAEAQLVSLLGRDRVSRQDDEIRLTIAPEEAPRISRALVSAGIDLHEMRREERSLEAAFLAMSGPSEKGETA